MTRRLALTLSAAGVVMIAGVGYLWARHGGSIYFDAIANGLANCF